VNKDENEIELIAETPFLQLVKRGRWAFARRPKQISVVAIIAVTDENKLVLVEQYRPPTDSRVIELPAGLAGDIAGQEDEQLQTAAERELVEETGYSAQQWKRLPTVASSAGMTDERITLFQASKLKKISQGGGVETEDITIHEIPLAEVESWLSSQSESGKDVDGRVYAALHWVM